MSAARRLSIGYVVPGHNLLATAGPTRNVLSLAGALARSARVAVAFRRIIAGPVPEGVEAESIEPGGERAGRPIPGDDAALRGIGWAEFCSFLHSLNRYLGSSAGRFDVLLEKSWLLSGRVSAWSRRRGIPAILVENYYPAPPPGAGFIRRIRLGAARRLAGRYARRAALVIAETEELKATLAQGWSIPMQRIEVVGLGVDRSLFQPRDRAEAARALGIEPGRTVLLYAGVLDQAHDLRPLLEALAAEPELAIEIHVVGDGRLAETLRAVGAECGGRVRFHGTIAHAAVPAYIAASDLCLAPYDADTFAGRTVGYATLKIPEYLAAGRPVASVPSGHIRDLIRPGVDGFLLENEAGRWRRFLREELPERGPLALMGEAAARSAAIRTWEETAERYLELCERVLGAACGGCA